MNFLVLGAAVIKLEDQGENYPFCLYEVDGIPLVERIINACHLVKDAKVIVALREDEVTGHHLDEIVRLIDPQATIVTIKSQTGGAACTALLAIEHIDSSDELVILNMNEVIAVNFKEVVENFHAQGLDAGVITFPSIHPRYSYVRLNLSNRVIEAAEKRPISRLATAGFYWFTRGSDFVRAAKSMILKNASVNGLFYICPTLNELVLEQRHIGVYQIEAKNYHPIKTERQLMGYEPGVGEAVR